MIGQVDYILHRACIQVLVFWTVTPQDLLNVGRTDVTTPVTHQSQPRQSFYSGCRIFGRSVGFSGCIQSITAVFFIPLVATGFGDFDHQQANATQNLKRLVTCSRLEVYVHYM